MNLTHRVVKIIIRMMALSKKEKNARYYAKLKADPERYKRIRERHNRVRRKHPSFRKR